ncbi:alpha-keto acid decarboxylase family protein [Methylocystis sp. Sn-Cys]|uniref:alpha-keto acid decarboxylase family protein n=1 Tax=Methylocystis sp. Sn-Cys TaxID=1701263 RepID=UPI001923CF61|nr:thiamine pyrophosphate-binding protein [Methylocystis sp. Sn-Cys]MBL1257499.1 alpha-keto acid decarboxylase family protein [Methylocystis sp. Sn-Cys]
MAETIGGYLIRRLGEEGVGHVFGVPGDYCLTFFSLLEKSPLQVVNTCDEQGAGFAADAYARIKGLGVVALTYCVGGLKAANTIAQAYAERSPVILIGGAPGAREQARNPLLHHRVRDFDTQLKVFRELTVATAVLDDATTAASEIDRAIALAKRHSRPVYIELPRDMTLAEIAPAPVRSLPAETSDPEALAYAVAEAVDKIAASNHPVILAGEELHRFRLQDRLMALVEISGIPVAASIMGKSVFPESHPAYMGVYEGAMGREDLRDYVESSDCLILLGAMMTDVNLGIYTAHIDRRSAIYAGKDRVAIGLHAYDGVRMEDFIAALSERPWAKRAFPPFTHPLHPGPFEARDRKMTVDALFRQINAFLEKDMIVIADTGDALLGASDLFISDGAHFLASAYYTSLGFAVPASLGVKTAAPKLRPLVLVGDGAFQMTGLEISTAARFGMNPIVILLDNDGYGTERPMLDGGFNDIKRWNYAGLEQVIGGGLGIRVETEREMAAALARARANEAGWSLIQVILDRDDKSPALRRLTAKLAERVGGKC